MKNIKYILLFVLIAAGCEEVIELDLNSTRPLVVIEGVITNKPGPYEVKISETVDFFKPNEFPKISGAIVRISDDTGNIDVLEEIEPGLYRTDSLVTEGNHSYYLSVKINNTNYQGESTLLESITIDSLSYEFDDSEVIGKKNKKGNYKLHVHFNDQKDIRDYCILRISRNDTLLDRNFLYDGKYTDGQVIDYNRFGNRFNKGDQIKVELITMSKVNFQYFSTLNEVIADEAKGPGGFAETGTPANPVTNIDNGALGFFGAFAIDVKRIEIR